MANDKYLFVVSGAAGTGKDSVVKALREAHPEIEKTVSATTRAPRPGEQEGVDYYYRTREQFQQLIENDQVVEHNFYNGNYYGTLKAEVEKRLEAKKVVVLVIDVHGAENIRRMFPGATTVFLLPPLHPGAGAPPARPRHRDRGEHSGAPCHGKAGTGPAGQVHPEAGQQRGGHLRRGALSGHLPARRSCKITT